MIPQSWHVFTYVAKSIGNPIVKKWITNDGLRNLPGRQVVGSPQKWLGTFILVIPKEVITVDHADFFNFDPNPFLAKIRAIYSEILIKWPKSGLSDPQTHLKTKISKDPVIPY